jgi:DMSO/TMAO reductase YedYZ molybdopterin-dependent catalytic subunit
MKLFRRTQPHLQQLARDVEPDLRRLERRLFLKQSLSLGAVAMLTGCSVSSSSMDTVLARMSTFNDWAQGQLFDARRLAPTFTDADITRPFPFNAFYSEPEAPTVDPTTYQLELSGAIADKRPWNLSALRALPQETQITRHICVEGWSAIGKWGGVPFKTFLERVGADLTAKYVGFKCADTYHSSIDMATALHPQTIIALTYDGAVLPRAYGFPMKLRIPTKLGFKNPKYILSMFVTNDYPGGYWEDQGYNWFSGS